MCSPLGLFRFSLFSAIFLLLCAIFTAALSPSAFALAVSDAELACLQNELRGLPPGERMAFWAERFVTTPYDPDLMGEYVRRSVIVADERVDCMYHVFRSAELALSANPEDAVLVALDKRFHGRGVMKNGLVVNYEDRFAFGEDMVFSGKWGKVVTADIGPVARMRGSRGISEIIYIPKHAAVAFEKLKPGDIVFLVNSAHKRRGNEIVGHMGIVAIDEKTASAHFIHAGGVKGKGGAVRKVPLKAYLATMPFAGIMITRFQ